MPRIRSRPEDFLVEELPLYPPAGEGEHTYLWVEKRLRTTDQVARDLARAAGVSPREVGYAGRKDRIAVARQWFSVPGLDPERALALDLPGARVLEAIRHRHKLRTGHLRGNRFRLVVREVAEGEARRAGERLRLLLGRGLPNRFGEQRFGREGGNVEAGLAILRGGRVRGDRRRARLLVSAVQSEVFNRVLARRPWPLDAVVEGDVAVVHARGGLFLVEEPEREAVRAAAFEVSATGPIFGRKMRRPGGEVAALEAAVMAELGLPGAEAVAPPRGIRLDGGRRPLRVRPEGLAWAWREGVLHLEFELPPGSYATVMMAELFSGPPI